jgi:glutamate synthase domain-containing protein 2
VVETDGQLKTGRDVVIAALLGAEEFGFCHRAAGGPGLHHDARLPSEHLSGGRGHPGSASAQEVHGRSGARGELHAFIAMEVRESWRKLGFRTLNEMVGAWTG